VLWAAGNASVEGKGGNAGKGGDSHGGGNGCFLVCRGASFRQVQTSPHQ
jgi:hypothetical protein